MNKNLMAGPPEMMAVHENKEANRLTEIYIEEYERAFGIKPVFDPGNFHIGIFKDIHQATKEKGEDIVRQFFHIKDEWFQKQGYTPECLKKNLATIALSLKQRAHAPQRGPTTFVTTVTCDECFRQFDLTTTKHGLDSDQPRICNECGEKTNMEPKG